MSCRVLTSCLGLCVLGFAGCASHVEWAPDSKSFLYSHQDGRILRYDVATRESKEVVRTKAVGDDCWPVYSQRAKDGLIVFAESVTVGDGGRRVRTTLHYVQSDGTPLRTHSLVWVASEDESRTPEPTVSYVEWSPKGSHVLLTTKSSVALHDFAGGRFTVHEELAPAMPFMLGASPWRPDGAGFLATKTADSDEDDVYFVTLDGNSHLLKGPKSDDDDAEEGWPFGEWSENTLVTVIGKREYRFDTTARTAEHRVRDTARKPRWKVGRASVEVEGIGDNATVTWTNGTKQLVVTRKLGPVFSSATGPVVPSPDGQRVVVVGKSGLVVVGESGVLDRIPVAPNGDDGNQ